MNGTKKSHYESLATQSAQAKFMLSFGVDAKLDVSEDFSIVFRACVGDVKLPITGVDSFEVREKGKQWLEEKAA